MICRGSERESEGERGRRGRQEKRRPVIGRGEGRRRRRRGACWCRARLAQTGLPKARHSIRRGKRGKLEASQCEGRRSLAKASGVSRKMGRKEARRPSLALAPPRPLSSTPIEPPPIPAPWALETASENTAQAGTRGPANRRRTEAIDAREQRRFRAYSGDRLGHVKPDSKKALREDSLLMGPRSPKATRRHAGRLLFALRRVGKGCRVFRRGAPAA